MSKALPGKSNKLIINIKPATFPPEISINLAAASAVPPVAIRSSITKIFSPLFIESLWTSIVASPYSSWKSTECLSAGNLFFFLRRIKGFLVKYETVEAKINLSNKVYRYFGKINLNDYIKDFLRKNS